MSRDNELEIMLTKVLMSKLMEESEYDEDDYCDMLGKEKPKPAAAVEVVKVEGPEELSEELSEEAEEPEFTYKEDSEDDLENRIKRLRK